MAGIAPLPAESVTFTLREAAAFIQVWLLQVKFAKTARSTGIQVNAAFIHDFTVSIFESRKSLLCDGISGLNLYGLSILSRSAPQDATDVIMKPQRRNFRLHYCLFLILVLIFLSNRPERPPVSMFQYIYDIYLFQSVDSFGQGVLPVDYLKN